MIHVDDFLVAASQDALDWVCKDVSRVYALKKKIMSSAPEDAHETTYLNRKLKWNEANWMSYEGVVKHAGAKQKSWRTRLALDVRSLKGATRSFARINFTSQDRPDVWCAARILSKHMASPTDGSKHALIHVVKNLKGHARCVNEVYASIPDEDYKVTVCCDSDWANDIAGRKSLLAGVPVTFCSKSQSNIALSSGEAELNRSVKAISETLV